MPNPTILGDNLQHYSPIVAGLFVLVSGLPLSDFQRSEALEAGGSHSIALVVDATVRTWGRNDLGQLGHGSTTFRQFLDHVRRDHGRGVVRELQDRGETEWRSSDGGVVPATRAVESADAEEIDAADLIDAALDPPADARPQAEVDSDDPET